MNDLILPVKFNRKTYELNYDDAIKFAQMGMKYENMLPYVLRLKSIAKRDGFELKEFIDNICNEKDAVLKSELMQKVNNDEQLAEILFKNICGDVDFSVDEGEDSPDIESDFLQIKDEFDMFKSVSDLPDEIKNTYFNEQISLYDAVLRYLYNEQKLKNKERKNRNQNGNANYLPKIANDYNDDSAVFAMIKGIKYGI